jgi:hypothetical protein
MRLRFDRVVCLGGWTDIGEKGVLGLVREGLGVGMHIRVGLLYFDVGTSTTSTPRILNISRNLL